MLMLSITSTAFSAGEEGSDNAPQLDPIFELSDAEVKAAVSNSMGYTIGTSYTCTSQYKVNIPANKKWEI